MTDIIMQLTTEDQATLARYSAAENRPQEDWAKDVLAVTLQRLAKRDAATEASLATINKAFELLDDPVVSAMHLAPTSRLPVPKDHPCEFLNKEQPTLYAGQCEGTCHHRIQTGRPCYYGAGSARQCSLFMSKRAAP